MAMTIEKTRNRASGRLWRRIFHGIGSQNPREVLFCSMVTDCFKPNEPAMWFGPPMPIKAYTQINNSETVCPGIL